MDVKGLSIEISIIAGIALISSVVSFFVLRKINKKAELNKKYALSAFSYVLKTPLIFIIWLFSIKHLCSILQSEYKIHLKSLNIDFLVELFTALIFIWIVLKFLSKYESIILTTNRKGAQKTTAIAITRLFRVLTFISAALIIMQTLGISLTGFLTLGGAGTLIFGIAAKDLLANFFGGFVIFTDRPFAVGDWIRSPDRNIEGTVEHIGWRITRIRTFDARPLYVQNSTFLSVSIENPSRMLNRRINKIIGLRYSDVTKIPKILKEIEKLIETHADLDQTKTHFVVFQNFSESTLDCNLYCFTKTTLWIDYLKVQEDVLLKIAGIINKNGAEIAYPTRTIDMQELSIINKKKSA